MISMRTPRNILLHELVGLECIVMQSRNRGQVGIGGRIDDETLKTLVISGKRVFKRGSVFRVTLEDRKIDVDGDHLLTRSEDRIKKKLKRW